MHCPSKLFRFDRDRAIEARKKFFLFLWVGQEEANSKIANRGEDFFESWLSEEIVANPPFLSISEAEGFGTGEKKNAPAMKHSHRFLG